MWIQDRVYDTLIQLEGILASLHLLWEKQGGGGDREAKYLSHNISLLYVSRSLVPHFCWKPCRVHANDMLIILQNGKNLLAIVCLCKTCGKERTVKISCFKLFITVNFSVKTCAQICLNKIIIRYHERTVSLIYLSLESSCPQRIQVG